MDLNSYLGPVQVFRIGIGIEILYSNFLNNFNPIFQSGLKFQSWIETQFSATFWIEIQKWQNQD